MMDERAPPHAQEMEIRLLQQTVQAMRDQFDELQHAKQRGIQEVEVVQV